MNNAPTKVASVVRPNDMPSRHSNSLDRTATISQPISDIMTLNFTSIAIGLLEEGIAEIGANV